MGRVSTRGVFPLSWNLDHVGTLSRCVRDAAILLSTLAGFDPHDPTSVDTPVDNYCNHLEEGVKNWKVAIAVGSFFQDADPQILDAMVEASRVFKNLGAQVEKVDLSWIGDLALANGLMTQADGATVHRDRLASNPEWFGADVRQRLEVGAALSSSDYVQARRTQSEGRRHFETFFTKYDLLILPTTPIPAPLIEGTGAIEAARRLTRFTAPFNLTGLPVLSIPCGFMDGMPFGLQLVTKHWDEGRLLQAGYAYEQVTPWHTAHPLIS